MNHLSGPSRPPASGRKAKQLIVFLHGLGADGNDLLSLSDLMKGAFPDAHFASPNAPYPCDMAPFGYQWFSLMSWAPANMAQGAEKAAPILNEFLDAELKTLGLSDGALALIGFSQGTMMALYAALRRPKPCAAVVGYSGALLAADTLSSTVTSRPPVCLIHGALDNVVPYAAMGAAEMALGQAGVAVETHTRPMLAHGIDPEGVDIAAAFLKRHLL